LTMVTSEPVLGGCGLAMTATVVVGEGGGGGFEVNLTVVVGGAGGLLTTVAAGSGACTTLVGGASATTARSGGAGSELRIARLGGGLATTASSEPHPAAKPAMRTTGMAKLIRWRKVLWRLLPWTVSDGG